MTTKRKIVLYSMILMSILYGAKKGSLLSAFSVKGNIEAYEDAAKSIPQGAEKSDAQNLGREKQSHDKPRPSVIGSAKGGYDAARSFFGKKKK